MKHLLTLAALLLSTTVVAQIPTFPWNPDSNADQFIGMGDLLELLAVYGEEFENAVVSEDGESAIVYIGQMNYPPCALACQNLPGNWALPNMEDLGLVWNEVNLPGTTTITWLNRTEAKNSSFVYYYSGNGYKLVEETDNIDSGDFRDCYCAAKQIPKVEYTFCTDTGAALQECANSLVNDGWLPLGGPSAPDIDFAYQAFWRFAQ